MKKLNLIIEKNIKKILSIFFILQPILDVIAALSLNYLKTEITLSSITRLIFLFFCIYYIFFINKEKENKKYMILLFAYFLCYTITVILKKDTSVLLYELKNTINTFYFPIILISLTNMFKKYNIKINIKNYAYIYLIYALFIIIPNITHTGFSSYAYSKTGNSGWFLSANAVGNILSIILPLIIYFIATTKKQYILKITLLISTLYIFLSIGTKTPLISLIICIMTTFIYYLYTWIKNKNYKNIIISTIISIISIISIITIIPNTSFYKNIEIHKEYLGITNYFEILKNYELIDHFIFSQRLSFLNNTSTNYKHADTLQKIFGIGYIENYGTDKVSTKMIEIDYFDILYRQGIIGSIIFTYIILSFYKKTNLKNSLLKLELKTSILLILLLALFTGHILNSPSASIFVTTIIICYQGGTHEKNN